MNRHFFLFLVILISCSDINKENELDTSSTTTQSSSLGLESSSSIAADSNLIASSSEEGHSVSSESTDFSSSSSLVPTQSSAVSSTISSSSFIEVFEDISMQTTITSVQPMTGIVLWNGSGNEKTDAIQLEYSYMDFDLVAIAEDPTLWDWSGIESLLNKIAANNHQAIFRFFYSYPGKETTVPAYIKNNKSYAETTGKSEGLTTSFPDWSSQLLKDFTKTFYTEFAKRYDEDPRIAFLQVGFGLWAEYHIYDPGEELGVNFPAKDFQIEFFKHLTNVFNTLHWSLSIDAADESNTPFASNKALLELDFGLFDDSFLNSDHSGYNKESFDFFGAKRRLSSPVGGEFSYYTDYDQQHVLDLPNGPHGVSYEEMAAEYNVSYMIGNDQPEYQSLARIKQAGIASGYHFEITSFKASKNRSKVTIVNQGIAPIYYNAFVTVNGVRSIESLKSLAPKESKVFLVESGGDTPVLTIECDRLVPGQKITFEAHL